VRDFHVLREIFELESEIGVASSAERQNQLAALHITPKRFIVIVTALVVIALAVWGLRHLSCIWMKPVADEAVVEEAMNYMHLNVHEPEAQDMYQNWKLMAKLFPVVRIDECEGEEMAYQCKLQREEMTIGKAIWNAHGKDRIAYRALAIFAEYQHTKTGGNRIDDQATQDIFERVRRAIPAQHRTDRIGRLHHKGTVNHGF
jgi:hypothetical protein